MPLQLHYGESNSFGFDPLACKKYSSCLAWVYNDLNGQSCLALEFSELEFLRLYLVFKASDQPQPSPTKPREIYDIKSYFERKLCALLGMRTLRERVRLAFRSRIICARAWMRRPQRLPREMERKNQQKKQEPEELMRRISVGKKHKILKLNQLQKGKKFEIGD